MGLITLTGIHIFLIACVVALILEWLLLRNNIHWTLAVCIPTAIILSAVFFVAYPMIEHENRQIYDNELKPILVSQIAENTSTIDRITVIDFICKTSNIETYCLTQARKDFITIRMGNKT